MSAPTIEALREDVLSQPPATQVEYALGLLEYYLEPISSYRSALLGLGLRLTVPEMRVLHALDKRRGHFLTHSSVASAAHFDRPADEAGDVDQATKIVSSLRCKLRALDLPMMIESRRNIGWRLNCPDWFQIDPPERRVG